MDYEARQAAKDLREMLKRRSDNGKPLLVYEDEICDAIFGEGFSNDMNANSLHCQVNWLIGILEKA